MGVEGLPCNEFAVSAAIRRPEREPFQSVPELVLLGTANAAVPMPKFFRHVPQANLHKKAGDDEARDMRDFIPPAMRRWGLLLTLAMQAASRP